MKLKQKKTILGVKAWIEDKYGDVVVKKFDLMRIKEDGPFVVVQQACKVSGQYLSFIKEDFNNSCDRLYATFPKKVSENLWKVGNGQCGFDLYDNQGRLLFSNLKHIGTSYSARILIKNDIGLWGYIDEYGRIIRKCQYDRASDYFNNGYALVANKDGDTYYWHSLDIIGRNCPPYVKADKILFEDPDSKRFVIKRESGWGVCNRVGEILIKCEYDMIEKKDKFYILNKKNKYGLAYEDGRIICDCIYPEIFETQDKFIVQEFAKKEVIKSEYIR